MALSLHVHTHIYIEKSVLYIFTNIVPCTYPSQAYRCIELNLTRKNPVVILLRFCRFCSYYNNVLRVCIVFRSSHFPAECIQHVVVIVLNNYYTHVPRRAFALVAKLINLTVKSNSSRV